MLLMVTSDGRLFLSTLNNAVLLFAPTIALNMFVNLLPTAIQIIFGNLFPKVFAMAKSKEIQHQTD